MSRHPLIADCGRGANSFNPLLARSQITGAIIDNDDLHGMLLPHDTLSDLRDRKGDKRNKNARSKWSGEFGDRLEKVRQGSTQCSAGLDRNRLRAIPSAPAEILTLDRKRGIYRVSFRYFLKRYQPGGLWCCVNQELHYGGPFFLRFF